MRLRPVVIALSTLFAACSVATSEEAVSSSDSNLVGGSAATDGEFPSTFLIRSNCTVSKVGPRHILTAGHCVFDESAHALDLAFQPGQELQISSHAFVDSSTEPFIVLKIAAVHLPPVFAEDVTPPQQIRVLQPSAAPDVAIIEVAPESEAGLSSIPAATIDLSTVAPGDKVIIGGYGCDKGVTDAVKFDYSKQQLKMQSTATLPSSSIVHAGSYLTSLSTPWAKNLVQQYFFTPGQSFDASQASICPGDSGGPVYRDDGTKQHIVGVNAYYSFPPSASDPHGISRTNWHTRLDLASRFDTGTWLASLGVNVTGGTPSSHYDNCESDLNTRRMRCAAFREAASDGSAGAAISEARRELVNGTWTWQQAYQTETFEEVGGQTVTVPLSRRDPCIGKRAGAYCGTGIGDPDPNVLYQCGLGGTVQHIVCGAGCRSNPAGVPDACN